ncbi:phytoene desaturase family protein [Rubellimicrobium roseum]|uniref:Pyridine nucleotide-disulfide oxidoreductase domain-containing protein 2 n=1 Tax=Rubellimicrobium roseum TaxID=687525 RepID=A0A5C4NHC8_9RHOB|nr:NAD(P)/FAD-dependent oxidoreductase [Rubellimicrobium roseum]TNC73330.1 NAD(P)/FAD-dependent oxidoreductase [Rubellimicrobium roseum]
MAAHHVVIGSGINALVAAAMLSLKGGRVTVLERESVVGGCLRTEELIPGFRIDAMAATWVLFVTGPAYGALGGELERHGLEFVHSPHPTAVVRPDGSALVLTMDRAANVAAFNALAPGDGDRHVEDVGGVERDAPFLFGLLGGPIWSGQTARMVGGQAWKRGTRGLAEWFGQSLISSRGWLESTYESPMVQALWAPWGLHAGLTPESAYSGQMGRVIAFALEAAGAPVAKGGSGRAAEAFRRLIEEKGGAVRTGADVRRILHEKGRVTGVELAGGERIAAGSVLASVTPTQLYGRLLEDADLPKEREAARRYRYGRGNFQLHYALDRAPEWLSPGLDDVALVHLTDGVDAVSRSANEGERGLLPAVPTICVGQPSKLDPSRCPPGKATLWLQIPDGPREVKGDAAGEIATQGAWTEEVRERFADRIEGILKRHIRDFDAIRLARRACSPADLERMNVNLVGGDPYGGACSIDQFFLWRPFKHSEGGRTPIRGLVQIGASTHPGPGLGGGSGFLAAKGLGA